MINWTSSEVKSFVPQKIPLRRLKDKPVWEKTFVNLVSDKGIVKELS